MVRVLDARNESLARLKVTAKRSLTSDVCSLRIEDPDGRRLPDWTPGAHIDLVLGEGLTRQYSLCGDRWDTSAYEIGVLLEPEGRGGSAFVHHRLAEGDLVTVGGPRNNFHLAPAEHYLFIAGGIGITPVLPMVHQAELLGLDWTLLYGGRTRGTMAFLDVLEAYGDRVLVRPQDEHGHLDLAGYVERADDRTKVYCCGPAPLLAALESHCAGWAPGRLRTERFQAKESQPAVRDEAFELELARSGLRVTVTPEMSVLDAIEQAGVSILSSCREGTCGTCETAVVAGTPDHRDSILDDVQRQSSDCMLPCVSRSCTDRLVLEL